MQLPSLSKTKTILDLLVWKHPRYVGVVEDGVGQSVVYLEMQEDAWLDMGCPSQITVTVEPGDTLNGGAK